MQIVITGGCGFIGSHLCDYYIAKGDSVTCVDNLSTGSLDNISHLMGNEKFTFINHDVSKPLFLEDKHVDAILHFASPASPPSYQRLAIETLKVGALGTHNMLGLAKAKKAKFLLASTSEVYGDPNVNPQPETYWGHVNCVGDRGMYDEAKRFSEALTMAYHHKHNIDTKIARIFNTYGTRMKANDGRVVPNFIDQAIKGEPITIYGSGKQTRSFCYITDMVDGIDKLLQSNLYKPINLGNPEERNIIQLAEIIKNITGSNSRIVYKSLPKDDPAVRCPDIRLAKTLLDWSPKVSLQDGLRECVWDCVHKLHREI